MSHAITLEKPKAPSRVHVQVIDPRTRKSRTFTVYNATIETAIDRIKQAFASPGPHPIPSRN
jgi:hypothetical protein